MKNNRKIRLKTIMDVKEFVSAASECEFDISISCNRYHVDAKSVLGVLSLDLTNELTVEYDGEDRALEEFLEAKDAAKTSAVA